MLACMTQVAAQKPVAQEPVTQKPAAFDPHRFKADVTYMSPLSYPGRSVSYGYALEVRNDSAFVYLPYMGRVHRPVLNDKGLDFQEPVRDFTFSRLRKGNIRVEFKVYRAPVMYRFTLTATPGGMMDIYMLPDNAQGCMYNAELTEQEE